ncbi:hypothetical protein CPBF424_40510 [Xanthomonas euroxanthea]|uniref:Uncharacterized protein n=1 Tax=Xanthomonas euroxanthea TaxID=2259622 RepID=A0AA46HCF2_9XANT|nr:hypothetical protein CPBF424_40510 [Xanthomonas euroxanthea]
MPVIGYSTLMVWPSVWLAPGASSITSGPASSPASGRRNGMVPVIGYSTLMVWLSVWLAPGASSITSGPALAASRQT